MGTLSQDPRRALALAATFLTANEHERRELYEVLPRPVADAVQPLMRLIDAEVAEPLSGCQTAADVDQRVEEVLPSLLAYLWAVSVMTVRAMPALSDDALRSLQNRAIGLFKGHADDLAERLDEPAAGHLLLALHAFGEGVAFLTRVRPDRVPEDFDPQDLLLEECRALAALAGIARAAPETEGLLAKYMREHALAFRAAAKLAAAPKRSVARAAARSTPADLSVAGAALRAWLRGVARYETGPR